MKLESQLVVYCVLLVDQQHSDTVQTGRGGCNLGSPQTITRCSDLIIMVIIWLVRF